MALLPSSKVFAQVPTVSIVGVSPQSGTTPPPVDVTILYITNEAGENLNFYVDGVLEGSATSAPPFFGYGRWTTPAPLMTAGTHTISITNGGIGATINYVVNPGLYPSWTNQPISLTAPNTYTATQTFTMPMVNTPLICAILINFTLANPSSVQFLVNGVPVASNEVKTNGWMLNYAFQPGQTYTVSTVVTYSGMTSASTCGSSTGLFEPPNVNSN